MPIDVNDFVAGWVGGAAGVVTSHALDTVKVQLQTAQSKEGTLQCVVKIFRNEGVRGFYKGMSFPLMTVAVYNSVVFGIFSNTNRILQTKNDGNVQRAPYYTEMIISSMFAGALSTCIGSPVDLIKVKLQSSNATIQSSPVIGRQKNLKLLDATKFTGMNWNRITTSKKSTITYERTSTAVKYNGPLHCLREVIHKGGVRGLYRGCSAMIIRDIPGYVIYFLPYFALCKLFRKHDEVQTGTGGLILAGGLAGMLSWGIMHPIDTIKSRIQADNTRYKGFFDCLRKTIQGEGKAVLFQGLAVNSLRGFPQSASLFLGYEMTIRALK